MAEFPFRGIDPDELESEIRDAYVEYDRAIGRLQVYSDADEHLRDLAFFARGTKKRVGIIVENYVQYYGNVLILEFLQSRLTTLLGLYKKYFPDNELEFVDMGELEKQIEANDCSSEAKRRELMSKFEVNYRDALERYFVHSGL